MAGQISDFQFTQPKNPKKKIGCFKRIIQFAAILFLCFFAVVIYSVIESAPKSVKNNANNPPVAEVPKDRNIRYIKGQDRLPYGVTAAAEDRLGKLAVAGDDTGIKQMILQGLALNVKGGTQVRIIDRGFLITEVRILEGPNKDKTIFIAPDSLVETKN